MLTLTVSKTRFNQVLGNSTLRPDGPQDGDMIYIPMTGNLWEVRYSSSRSVFYQLGHLRMYKFTLGLVEYNNQKFNTGIPAIDDKYNALSTDKNQTKVAVDDLVKDLFDSSEAIQMESDEILDFTEESPLARGNI